MSGSREGVPALIPAPSHVQRTGGTAATPKGCEALSPPGALIQGAAPAWLEERQTSGWCGADERVAQGYRLSVTRGPDDAARFVTESPTRAGLRNARATVVQLLRRYPSEIPCLEIDDRPVFKTRGVMLDVSRCRIPTMPELFRIIDHLAALKCNHLQLYTEHTFAYAGAEGVWRGWDPITPEEVRTLDSYCRERGIELAANQNCFGHLRNWLEHPKFGHLAETHGDWMFDVWPRSGPFSLCPTDPASLRFVEGLLDELLPNFSCPLVNIGCDETYDIAYGRSAGEVARRGRGVVFAEFVARIAGAARERGKRSMFWGDIALSHPECLKMLPEDMIALAWGYEPDAPWEKWCRACEGRDLWVCPGTSSWRSLTGRTTERRANLDGAARASEWGAAGYLVCDWGDSGHWQTWPIALHGLAEGLHAAWSGVADGNHLDAESVHVFGDAGGRVARWLDRFGDVDLALRRECMPLSRPGVAGHIRNQTAIFADLFQPWGAHREVGGLHNWVETTHTMGHLLESVPVVDRGLIDAELRLAAEMAFAAAARGQVRRMTADFPHGPTDQRRMWERLEVEHRTLWTSRSRPGGLVQSCAFFRKISFE